MRTQDVPETKVEVTQGQHPAASANEEEIFCIINVNHVVFILLVDEAVYGGLRSVARHRCMT